MSDRLAQIEISHLEELVKKIDASSRDLLNIVQSSTVDHIPALDSMRKARGRLLQVSAFLKKEMAPVPKTLTTGQLPDRGDGGPVSEEEDGDTEKVAE